MKAQVWLVVGDDVWPSATVELRPGVPHTIVNQADPAGPVIQVVIQPDASDVALRAQLSDLRDYMADDPEGILYADRLDEILGNLSPSLPVGPPHEGGDGS